MVGMSPMAWGAVLAAFAYADFSIHDAIIKWLVTDLPVWEVVFARSVVIFLIAAVAGGRRVALRALTTPLRWPLVGRSILLLVAWLLYFVAARSLPLAQMLTLYFSAPVMTTLMAGPLLGERVTRARLVAAGVGFVGVLVACNPVGLRISLPVLMVLAAAAMWAYAVILMRRIARREASMVQILFQNGFFLVATGLGSLATWQTPNLTHLALMLASGVIGGLGQFALFEAARRVPASVMGTLEYSSLLWAFVLGYAVWGDIPVPPVWIGAGLILGAGGLLLAAERRRR